MSNMPAASTIGDLLKRHGLVRPRRRRVHPSTMTPRPLAEATWPNDTWCIDFKGHFALCDRTRCHPLTITDQVARHLLKCESVDEPDDAHLRLHFVHVTKLLGGEPVGVEQLEEQRWRMHCGPVVLAELTMRGRTGRPVVSHRSPEGLTRPAITRDDAGHEGHHSHDEATASHGMTGPGSDVPPWTSSCWCDERRTRAPARCRDRARARVGRAAS